MRGMGAEPRTDAFGAVRGGTGLLVSSYRLAHASAARDPAGDNGAGIAMLKHAVLLGENFSKMAREHKTVEFAAHQAPQRKDESVLDEEAAPLKAILKAVSGMVSNASLNAAWEDAAAKQTKPDADKLPQTTDPVIAIAARGGLGVNASNHLQFNSGETVTVMSGQDTQFVTKGQLRIHSRQAIGMLGGAVEPGKDNMGLQLIAGKDPIDIQAQSDTIKIQALADVNVISANAHIDWASPNSISLSTGGGANITIAGGGIAIGCPGTILVLAGIKTFDGPGGGGYPLPKMPREICVECLLKAMRSGSALSLK